MDSLICIAVLIHFAALSSLYYAKDMIMIMNPGSLNFILIIRIQAAQGQRLYDSQLLLDFGEQ